MKNKAISQQFSLVGQLKGFIFKDGYKLKYLRLQVENIEYWIKVKKEHRPQFEHLNPEGIELKVTGEIDICHKTRKMTLNAEEIKIISPDNLANNPTPCKKAQKASILICQKSTCWKRGGAAIYRELTETLSKYGLEDQVLIKTTGCLKKCKQPPNLVFMPDRARYSCVSCEEVSEILAQHIALGARE
ncbi:MAG: (2Fe-2S) ferredoxin domain-containing protein [Gloeocapsa sp. DLM2.Bin57]|nr:MAG: (2Fe-2S) ferredoxin domain-containing protein [Gloeocapsa sp. DLM2.Bin57]